MKNLIILLFVGLILAACGTQKGYQSNSDHCSSEFISDYNKLVISRSRNGAMQFKNKYPGVNCKALFGGSETYINAESFANKIINSLN